MAISVGPPGSGHEANAPAPIPLPSARLRPVRAWYWAALVVFLAGVAWAALMSVVLIGRFHAFPRVPDPGKGVISLILTAGVI